MYFSLSIAITIAVLIAIGWWWRYRSLSCPVSLTFLLENRYMNAVAGPDKIFGRMGLGTGMKLLDVGCGPGRLALPAARFVGESGEVVALDVQAGMLEKLRCKATKLGIDNIRLVHAAAGCGAVEEGYFDRALLVTVLGEIPNKREALAEIYRALKEGGILSITEVIPDPHYTSRARVRSLCKETDFREVAQFGGWHAFTLNVEKHEMDKVETKPI